MNHLLTWTCKGHQQNWIKSHRGEIQMIVSEIQNRHKTKSPYSINPFLVKYFPIQWLTASSSHCFLHQIPTPVSRSAESTQNWWRWQSRGAGDETLAPFRSWCPPSVPEICPLSVALQQWLHPAVWGTCSWADRASLTWTNENMAEKWRRRRGRREKGGRKGCLKKISEFEINCTILVISQSYNIIMLPTVLFQMAIRQVIVARS